MRRAAIRTVSAWPVRWPLIGARCSHFEGEVRWVLPAFCLLLLVAWFLHWRAFGLAELGPDGALSVDLAQIPVPAMLAFTAGDVHPPLFYLLLHGWFDLAGATYLTAKFLPIAGGMVALAALYVLGRRLAGPAAGLIAGALFAISPADVYLGSTVRDYTPGLACSLVTLLLTVRLVRPAGTDHGRRDGILLAMSTASALLMWYFHPIFLAAEAILLLGSRGASLVAPSHGQRCRAMAAWALLTGIAVTIPWYAYTVPHLLPLVTDGATAFDGVPTLPTRAAAWHAVVASVTAQGGSALGLVATAGWLVALAAGVGAGHASSTALPVRQRARMLWGGFGLGATVVLWSALRWAQADALQRYILVVLPFAVLLQALALAAARLPWRLLAGAALIPVLVAQGSAYVALATGLPIAYTDDATFAYLAVHARPGDVLLFTDPQRRARYGLSGGTLPTAVIAGAEPRYLQATPQQAGATVAALVPRYHRIWYVESSMRKEAAALARAPLAARA